MLFSHRAALTLVLTSVLAACGRSALTNPSGVVLTTDASSYSAVPVGFGQVVVKVVTSFQNPTSTSIELVRCFPDTPYPIYSVELVSPNSAEGAAYSPAWACVGHDHQIVVASGETRIDTLTLRGPNAFDPARGRYLGVLEGTFRVSFGGRSSNEFTVKLPPGGVVP